VAGLPFDAEKVLLQASPAAGREHQELILVTETHDVTSWLLKSGIPSSSEASARPAPALRSCLVVKWPHASAIETAPGVAGRLEVVRRVVGHEYALGIELAAEAPPRSIALRVRLTAMG
jgi:hypothetical protein